MQSTNIDRLGELDKKIKELKVDLDAGKADIKNSVTEESAKIDGKNWTAVVSTRHSTKFNNDKATKICKDNSLEWLLKVVVDEDKLEDALVGGEIDTTLFEGCITETSTKSITFKEKVKTLRGGIKNDESLQL